ncbi:MAG: hypothetical protein ABEH38_06465, partial [Flavobacteriales bacterium]
VNDNGGTVSQDLSALLDSSYWDRDKVNGYLFPSTLSDQVGIGTNTPTSIVNTDMEVHNSGISSIGVVSTGSTVQGILTARSSPARISIGSYSDHDVVFWTGYGEIMRFNNAGGNAAVNSAQNSTNFQVKGDGEANLLFTDAVDDRVGIGDATPGHDLEIRDTDADGTAEIQIGSAELLQDRGANHLGTNSDFEVDQYLILNDAVEDNLGSTGNNEYVLSSTGTGVEWKDPANLSSIDTLRDNDWFYESSDSSLMRNVGTEQDCVLVGTNSGTPFYSYDFAVYNNSATGTRIGLGSVEYFTDQSNETTINNPFSPASDAVHDMGDASLRWDRVYAMEVYASDKVVIDSNSGGVSHDLHVQADSDDSLAYFDVNEGSGEDMIIDDAPADITLRPTSDGQGYIGTSGFSFQQVNAATKNFSIKHPTKKGHELKHTSLEGPEAGVYYRGEDSLENGKIVVELPDYFEALTLEEGRTVQLTPIAESGEPITELAASKVKNGTFTVRAIDPDKNPDQKFYWKVTAERADVPPTRVEIENKQKYDKKLDERLEEWRERYYQKHRGTSSGK